MNDQIKNGSVRVPSWILKAIIIALLGGVTVWVNNLQAEAVKTEGRMSTLEANYTALDKRIKRVDVNVLANGNKIDKLLMRA